MSGYKMAFKKAFPYTIPVLTGYLFIGIAFGVMYAEKGYSFLWAMLMSLLVYAGSGQYLAVNFFVPGISLIQVIFMTLMVNVRHIFYGISLLERFHNMGKKRWYMMFSLTDETYSLLCAIPNKESREGKQLMFCISLFDQLYWIIGSVLGATIGSLLAFDTTGIDFAMTALFTVIFVEQWLAAKQHGAVYIAIAAILISTALFQLSNFLLPALILLVILLVIFQDKVEKKEDAS